MQRRHCTLLLFGKFLLCIFDWRNSLVQYFKCHFLPLKGTFSMQKFFFLLRWFVNIYTAVVVAIFGLSEETISFQFKFHFKTQFAITRLFLNYFQLLTSNLVQRGDDDDGINGFLPSDVKSEVNRASKLVCFSFFLSSNFLQSLNETICLFPIFFFFNSFVLIAKKKQQQSVVVYERAVNPSICRVHWKMNAV